MAGFTLESESICQSLTDFQSLNVSLAQSKFSSACQLNKYLFKTKNLQTQFLADFQKGCSGQTECMLSLANLQNLLSDECKSELNKRVKFSKYYRESPKQKYGANADPRVAEPVFVVAVNCESGSLQVPFTKLQISRDHFGLLVIGIDILIIIILFLAIYVLEERVTEYIRAFKRTTIQMNDFTLTISNLPLYT